MKASADHASVFLQAAATEPAPSCCQRQNEERGALVIWNGRFALPCFRLFLIACGPSSFLAAASNFNAKSSRGGSLLYSPTRALRFVRCGFRFHRALAWSPVGCDNRDSGTF